MPLQMKHFDLPLIINRHQIETDKASQQNSTKISEYGTQFDNADMRFILFESAKEYLGSGCKNQWGRNESSAQRMYNVNLIQIDVNLI